MFDADRGNHTAATILETPPVAFPMPRRRVNRFYRAREYLTPKEIDKIIASVQNKGRNATRNAAMILVAYRHGLRVSELVALQWDQIDFHQKQIHVARLKRGNPSVHPLSETEIKLLEEVQERGAESSYVFLSERKKPLTTDAFGKVLAQAGTNAGIKFKVHPHMLRHACGFKLAQDGQDTRAIQDYLGHRNIQHTVRYTFLSSERFKSFWKD